jgi:signal transduction histidine kinase
VALAVPLAYFVLKTNQSLEQEEMAELRYFADALFDEMEQSLALLVLTEERRAVDEYNYHYTSPASQADPGKPGHSPLSWPSQAPYVVGYFQNNPDGSFHTPLLEEGQPIPPTLSGTLAHLNEVNRVFNQKRTMAQELPTGPPADKLAKKERQEAASLVERYLDVSRAPKQKGHLGQEEKRVEQISPGQALNLAQRAQKPMPAESQRDVKEGEEKDRSLGALEFASRLLGRENEQAGGVGRRNVVAAPAAAVPAAEPVNLQVELDPIQSVHIDDKEIFLFRRVVLNNQIYRQGVVIRVEAFLNHLMEKHFLNQPMARFASLALRAMDKGEETARVEVGAVPYRPKFILERGFPRPFSFLRATLASERIPRSTGRSTLNLMVIVLATVVMLGLFAIYQSARVITDLSERRSKFVSSVTHELKTPLTNIRMYIEMLEQGMARDHEREQEYFRILGSESARLSRLITNVMEFSKLETKQRKLELREGSFEEVIREIQDAMGEKLRQEGFTFRVERKESRPFNYDREVMVQLLINLMENSMKFGKGSPRKEITLRLGQDDGRTQISLSDTGPGIPRHALKKVFEDFYRVSGPLTRTTKGTGIGLALVKKFVTAMGGSVAASNNEGPGCTITISIPS